MRRKGERPLPVWLDSYTSSHPVARKIADGDYWFQAWLMHKVTPIPRLSKRTGISGQRLLTINARDRISQAELDAFARAWSISSADLRASIGDQTEIVP